MKRSTMAIEPSGRLRRSERNAISRTPRAIERAKLRTAIGDEIARTRACLQRGAIEQRAELRGGGLLSEDAESKQCARE